MAACCKLQPNQERFLNALVEVGPILAELAQSVGVGVALSRFLYGIIHYIVMFDRL